MTAQDIRRDALGLGVASAGLYLLTASRFVMGGDSGEFATLFAEPGVAHPPGYPAYVALGRALFWLPGATIAQRAARVSGLCAAAAVSALYLASRAWGASRWGALLAAVTLATSGLFWDLATRAEVFTLHALTSALIVAACAPDAPLRGTRRAIALGALAGVAAANHLTVVLLGPLMLYGLVRAHREGDGADRVLVAAVLSGLPGLSLYLLLARWGRVDDGRWLWGDPRTLTGIARHLVRADYGVAQLSAHGSATTPGEELAFLVRSVASAMHFAPLVLSAGAIAAVVRRPAALRSGRGALLLALAVCGPLFVSRFNIAPTGIGAAIVARFHLLPMLLLCVFVALGWDLVAPRLPPRAAPWIVLAFALASGAHVLPAALARDDARLERWALDALSSAPPNAALLVSGDHRGFALLYAQRALRVRRDVQVISPHLLLLAPYRTRVERRLGVALPAPVNNRLSSVEVARRILASGRPLFMTDLLNQAIVNALPSWPEGILVQVAPEGTPPRPPGEIDARSSALYARYHLPHTPAPDPWLALVHEDYARVWIVLADIATRYGAAGLAARMRARAETFTALGSR